MTNINIWNFLSRDAAINPRTIIVACTVSLNTGTRLKQLKYIYILYKDSDVRGIALLL